MHQTRIESLIESCLNIATGFVVSLAFWTLVVVPVWNLPVRFVDNLAITGCFTVLAIARSYLWRRFFNNGMHKAVHRFVLRARGMA